MLSLVAGGAIDEYILSQLRALRQEHQLARLIHSLQIMLWPGGLWFQRHPEKQAPVSPLVWLPGCGLQRAVQGCWDQLQTEAEKAKSK